MCSLVERITVRLPKSAGGTPRYFIGLFSLSRFLGVRYDKLEAVAKALGLKAYRGRRYRQGYVFASYDLANDLADLKNKVDLVRAVLEALPECEVRL